jgi:hypothetical protein
VSERRTTAFTLLEVLAAVAVLGLTVALLARGAIQGMRYEGDASRRLAASLLADRMLFEVESTLALGALPELGLQERDEGDLFRLTLEVAPLDPLTLGLGPLFAGRPDSPDAPPPKPPPEAPKLLLVTVRVAWAEGLVEQAVTRTTFAYDASAAAELLEAADAAAGAAQAEQEEQEEQQPEPEPEPEP